MSEPGVTVLVLRDIAKHLARGEVMIDGEWRVASVGPPRGRRRYQSGWMSGHRQANSDAIYALLQIAEMNAR